MKRIQRKNFYDYSWKGNSNAVYVGRPTKYGNPFKVSDYGLDQCIVLYKEWLAAKLAEDPNFLEPLRGKDLVCFCSLSSPCHGDILIEYVKKIYGDD